MTETFMFPWMGHTFEELLEIWHGEKPRDEVSAAASLRRLLEMGFANGAWDETAFIDLSMMLLRGRCSEISVDVLDWMEKNLSESDPALVCELRSIARVGSSRQAIGTDTASRILSRNP